jgi:5-methylcytosine-specific restriction enzyme subunit McrC
MVMKDRRPILVMDTKWKLIDASDRRNKYGVSQSDMYQLYAYGHKYLKDSDQKELMLIYPTTSAFNKPLPDFIYENGFRLQVVPFDLTTNLINLK